VLTARRVTAIDPVENGFMVEADGQRQIVSHVICALPPHQVNAFLIGITALSELAAAIERLRYQPIHSVWLQYPESIALPSPMLGFSRGLIHWVFDREKLCGQRGLIGVVISAEGAHQELAQDELGARAHLELRQRLGRLPDPLWQRVIAKNARPFPARSASGARRRQHRSGIFSGRRLHRERLPGHARSGSTQRHPLRRTRGRLTPPRHA